MRIFLDTNVLASAIATRGLCADLLQTVLAEHELIVGTQVLKELEDVLSRKFRLHNDVRKEYLALLRGEGEVVSGSVRAKTKLRDKDDEKIVANALAGKADVFITGDRELLALKKIGNVPILSPRGLWSLLQKA